jgi:hypothetical protein
VSTVVKKLKKVVNEKTLVFAPANIANHADHGVVKRACELLEAKLVLYSDFPYNVRNNNYGELEGYSQQDIVINYSAKKKLVSFYKTQYNGLFPDGIFPRHKEVFFIENTESMKHGKEELHTHSAFFNAPIITSVLKKSLPRKKMLKVKDSVPYQSDRVSKAKSRKVLGTRKGLNGIKSL